MRDILFRGKCENNGNWVKGGNISIFQDGRIFIIPTDTRIEGCRDEDGNYFMASLHSMVVPETVGQYTGLHDMNGKKIFEGDIVKYSQTYDVGCYPRTTQEIAVVEFSLGLFFPVSRYNTDRYEVIGNIHDNPELMEKVTVR